MRRISIDVHGALGYSVITEPPKIELYMTT